MIGTDDPFQTTRFPVPGTHPEPGTGESGRVPGSEPLCTEPGTGRLNLYADVTAYLDGTAPTPPEPDVLTRTDGTAVFYRGQVNHVFGDPESGKTFVALAAVAEELRQAGSALVVDMDHNGIESTVARLLMLGAPVDTLRNPARFRYAEPEDALHTIGIVSDCGEWQPAVIVLDSVGELLPMFGASSNSPDDFTGVNTRVMKPLALTGACVIAIDHLAKNAESRNHGATGTAAKKRTFGGVSLRVKIADQFVPGRGGSCHLTISKDRHGGLRQHCPTGDREPLAGTFVMHTNHDGTTWHVKAPAMTDRNPDEAAPAEDVAAVAALDPPPSSGTDVQQRLRWGRQRALVALREYRRQAPEPRVPGSTHRVPEPGTHPCTVCGFPLSALDVQEGSTTHASCIPEETPL